MSIDNKFDDILSELGTGKWNLVFLITIALWYMQIPMQSMGGAFLTPQIQHQCIVPPGATLINNSNITDDKSCFYHAPVTEELVPCTKWSFDNSTYGDTLTEEFELVCDRKFLRPWYNSIFFLGACFGAPMNGWLSDRFGRRKMLGICALVYILLANTINWLPNISLIFAVRFIMGTCHPACIDAGFTLVAETFERRYRSMAGIIIFLPWCFGMMALAGLAYILKDWRWLTFTVSIPVLLFIPAIWSLDESPRWLIVRGRHEEALKILQKAARWNEVSLPPQHHLQRVMNDITSESSNKKITREKGILATFKNFLDSITILYRSKKLRRITLSIYTINLALGIMYNGLSLGGNVFSSDPFIYMALSGVMDMPGNSLTIPVTDKFGRRYPNIVFLFVNAVVILSLIFIPQGIGWLIMTLALIGKLTISAAYQIFALHSCELFPTELRSRGTGTSSMLSKIGATLAPLIVDSLHEMWSGGPALVLGGGTLVAAGITYLLPDTSGKPLNDTVADLHKGDKNQKTVSSVNGEDNARDDEEPFTLGTPANDDFTHTLAV